MKFLSNFFVLAVFTYLCGNGHAQSVQNVNGNKSVAPPTAPVIVARDANSHVWERTEYIPGPNGQMIPKKHQYTELATGLCYQKNGVYVDSQEQITILPDGSAEAIQGQHQAYFPVDIYNGVIKLVTPDGLQLHSQPLGLSYEDGTNTVLIAELTNSVGQLISSNQVLYANAFVGISADLLYTYRKGGFEQDVVFRDQPPVPEQFGLNSANTRLQMLTEFPDSPIPIETTSPANRQDGLRDTTLKFGAMKMTHGKAFLSDTPGIKENLNSMPVYKSWATVDGRKLLIEQVPYQRISSQLATLPQPSTINGNSALPTSRKASPKRFLPPPRLVQAMTNTLQLATANSLQKPGVVLDFALINANKTNFTFRSDTTYYVSSALYLDGTNVFEGGTVLKYNSSSYFDLDGNGTIDCETAPYRPAVFTSVNDNMVGETIWGTSTGLPNFQDVVNPFFIVEPTNIYVHDFRFCYAWQAFQQVNTPNFYSIWNCQFLNVVIPVWAYDIYLYNDLIGYSADEAPEIQSEGAPELLIDGGLVAENVTSDSGYEFIFADAPGETMALTNCLITSELLADVSFSPTLLTNGVVYINSPSSPVYQTVGGGSYYLTNDSPYRGIGTTNIDPTLLTNLAEKTTYPPLVYSNATILASTTLGPVVERDNTGAPDLGYHYDPIDYAVCEVDVPGGINLAFSVGTAVAWFSPFVSASPSYGTGTPCGLSLENDASTTFKGIATAPCFFVSYNNVQEGCSSNWMPGYLAGIMSNGSYDLNNAPVLTAIFTHFCHMSYDVNHYRDGFNNQLLDVQMRHCEQWGADGAYRLKSTFTNCLIAGGYYLAMGDHPYTYETNTYRQNFLNCTFHDGTLEFDHGEGSPYWTQSIINCTFDGIPIVMPTNGLTCDYNAFITNDDRLPIHGAHDVIVDTNGFNWQSSWFGNFYLPSDSPLIDKGNTNANLLGLYHFTTQVDQTPEGTNIVDIGYHYVATDDNGIPLDTNGDGIPDYLEDPNGNGLVDSGEIGWNLSGDPGFRVIISQPVNGSVIP